LVVDLGCGSGRWARELNRAGFNVLGIDRSPAMIRLARKLAPRSQFRVASLWNARLPRCDAITSIGECLNYCFDRKNNQELSRLFKRAYAALRTGGVLIRDFAGPDRRPGRDGREHRASGRGWSVTSRITGHGKRQILRDIVAFRRVGGWWRRSEEAHELRLHSSREICACLKRCGFEVRPVGGYGRFRFPQGIHGVIGVRARAIRIG
jgi:SAM-dependent methyltransferase